MDKNRFSVFEGINSQLSRATETSAHVRSHDILVCPICNCTWKDIPLFTIHKNLNQSRNDVVEPSKPKPREVEKNIIVEASSPRASSKPLYDDEESLFFPTSQIIPIPEADDEDEDEDTIDPFPRNDDVEEFQGHVFFRF
ncbi:hypothetical protein GBA52_003384 [Prunus armeniaca]|nr:hypothetical protein GBA52_003384 [Prunus armeniaca]